MRAASVETFELTIKTLTKYHLKIIYFIKFFKFQNTLNKNKYNSIVDLKNII